MIDNHLFMDGRCPACDLPWAEANNLRHTPICGELARLTHVGGGLSWHPCQLDPGHGGYHAVTAFTCDSCEKRRRYPFHDIDSDGITVCWICFLKYPEPEW